MILFSLWSFITGCAIVVQTGINGELGRTIHSPLIASMSNFAVGTVTLGLLYMGWLLLGMEKAPGLEALKGTHWWMWVGGLIGAMYVLSCTVVPGKIGFANFFCLVVAGQLTLSVVMDHFGFLGADVHPVNLGRVAGILLIVAGVLVVQKH